MSLRRFAKLIDEPYANVWRWEKGYNGVRQDAQERIKQVFPAMREVEFPASSVRNKKGPGAPSVPCRSELLWELEATLARALEIVRCLNESRNR